MVGNRWASRVFDELEHGDYGPPFNGQIISRADALELGAALERALAGIPADVPDAPTARAFVAHCRECAEFWLL